jgi:tetratricopeptide (TPR) repeat protein
MERNVLRTRSRLIASLFALALVVPAVGCGNKLEKARSAWADGEGDFDDAERLYKEAMEKDKTRDEAKIELAAIYATRGKQAKSRPKIADKFYEKALALDPQNEEALEGRARAMIARGLPDDAIAFVEQGAASGKCKPCKRVLSGLLIDRGDRYYRANQFAEAESDYTRASAILPNAHVALGIVRARLAQGKTEAAAEALRPAVDLINVHDLGARQQFLELRKFAVMAALNEDKAEIADKMLDLVPDGVGAEEQVDLAIEVALEMRKRNKPEPAVERLESLLGSYDQGKLKISAGKISDIKAILTGLYVARSASRLAKGDLDGADADIVEALKLRPNEPALMLQRVLISAGKNERKEAEAALQKIDSKTSGYGQVSALLSTMKVHELVTAGKVDAARNELERAKAKAPDLPEVHVATAELLALTEVENLKKKDVVELKKTGLVKYDGKVTRMGEALSELDWSKQSLASLGADYPYRGPGTDKLIEELVSKLSAKYGFKVKFNKSSKPIIVFKNDGAAPVQVKIKCLWTVLSEKVAPSKTSKFTADRPGFCTVELGGKPATWLAEPYTETEIPL